MVSEVGNSGQGRENFWQARKLDQVYWRDTRRGGSQELTFKVNIRVWVHVGGIGERVLKALIVILAVNFEAVVIDECRVSANDAPPRASVLDLLFTRLGARSVGRNIRSLLHASLYTSGPVGGASCPCRVNRARFFSFWPRLPLWSIESSESDSD